MWPEALEGMSKLPRLGQEVIVTDSIGAFIGRGLMDAGTGPAIRIFSRDERDPPLRKLLFRRIATARRLRERLVQPSTDAFRRIGAASLAAFDELHVRRVALKSIQVAALRTSPATGQRDLFDGVGQHKERRLGAALTELRERLGGDAVVPGGSLSLDRE